MPPDMLSRALSKYSDLIGRHRSCDRSLTEGQTSWIRVVAPWYSMLTGQRPAPISQACLAGTDKVWAKPMLQKSAGNRMADQSQHAKRDTTDCCALEQEAFAAILALFLALYIHELADIRDGTWGKTLVRTSAALFGWNGELYQSINQYSRQPRPIPFRIVRLCLGTTRPHKSGGAL